MDSKSVIVKRTLKARRMGLKNVIHVSYIQQNTHKLINSQIA